MGSRLQIVGALLLAGACQAPFEARQATVVDVLVRADEVHLRTRPELVKGKFERMAKDPFAFFRGNLPLARRDWEAGRTSNSGFLSSTQPVFGLGDPHPENFGLLADRDGALTLEPNDFDAADSVPYLFDLRRLLTGLALGARLHGLDPAPVAEAGARAYVQAFTQLPVDGPSSRIVEDLFRRGRRDLAVHAELDELTVVDDSGQRRFRRGAPDPAEPTASLEDLPPEVVARIPEALGRLGSEASVKDAVRQFGSGVASWPRVRMLVLIEGATEALSDDVVLELKELPDSVLAGWYSPTRPAEDTPSRVEAACRRSWSRPDADPRWVATTWWGVPLQVRTEAEGQKPIRVSRWVGALGTVDEVSALAVVLSSTLARVHLANSAEVTGSVRRQLDRDPDAFVAEQTAFAAAESAVTLADAQRFSEAWVTLGPTLGVTSDPRELPAAESPAARLFGTPPTWAPLDGGTL